MHAKGTEKDHTNIILIIIQFLSPVDRNVIFLTSILCGFSMKTELGTLVGCIENKLIGITLVVLLVY